MSTSPLLGITLITGFLGSGKTTLLQKIVKSPEFRAENSALLINDAGPVNVDAKVFRGKASEIRALTGGCVCCVNPDEMKSTLLEFAANPKINQVWIEASGVAETDDILDRLMDHPLPLKTHLKEIIHIISAEMFSGWSFDKYSQKNQAALANRIILNKVDLVKPQNLKKIITEVQNWNPNALMQCTSYSEVDFSITASPLTSPSTIDLQRKKSSHLSWKTQWVPLSTPISFERVKQFLDTLPNEVYRAKGFFISPEKGNPVHFIQKVGPQAEVISWPYEGDVTEMGLVLLAHGIDLEKIECKI